MKVGNFRENCQTNCRQCYGRDERNDLRIWSS